MTKARHALDRARIEHNTQEAHRIEEKISQKAPVVDRVQRRINYVEVLGACASFVSSAHRSLPSVITDGTSEADKQVLQIELNNVRDAVDWCTDAVRARATGLDAQLAQLLTDEGRSDD